jgi:hypothetical protein
VFVTVDAARAMFGAAEPEHFTVGALLSHHDDESGCTDGCCQPDSR